MKIQTHDKKDIATSTRQEGHSLSQTILILDPYSMTKFNKFTVDKNRSLTKEKQRNDTTDKVIIIHNRPHILTIEVQIARCVYIYVSVTSQPNIIFSRA